MKIAKLTGLLCAALAMSVGLFFSISPVLDSLRSGEISGYQAGISLAIIATLLGLTCAVIGIISNRSAAKNNVY